MESPKNKLSQLDFTSIKETKVPLIGSASCSWEEVPGFNMQAPAEDGELLCKLSCYCLNLNFMPRSNWIREGHVSLPFFGSWLDL